MYDGKIDGSDGQSDGSGGRSGRSGSQSGEQSGRSGSQSGEQSGRSGSQSGEQSGRSGSQSGEQSGRSGSQSDEQSGRSGSQSDEQSGRIPSGSQSGGQPRSGSQSDGRSKPCHCQTRCKGRKFCPCKALGRPCLPECHPGHTCKWKPICEIDLTTQPDSPSNTDIWMKRTGVSSKRCQEATLRSGAWLDDAVGGLQSPSLGDT